jgi:hypothetical protein
LGRLYLCKISAHTPVLIYTKEIETNDKRSADARRQKRGEERERGENICLIPTLLPASENKKIWDDSIGRRGAD